MHFSSIITTLLMQFAICISLHFQLIENFSFLLPTLEEVGELNFKGPLSATSAGHSSVQSTTDTSAGDSSLPAEFDWRDHHKVTSVRDQRQCNACYAFAVTSAIESALAIQYDINIDSTATTTTTATRSTPITVTNSAASRNSTESGNSTSNNLSSVHMVNMKVTSTRNEHYVNLNLSVQQLIDCTFMRNRSRESNTSSSSSSSSVSSYSSSSSTKSNSNYYRNNACQYGYIEDTFRYVVENGLLPEEIYPYEMQVRAKSWLFLLFCKSILLIIRFNIFILYRYYCRNQPVAHFHCTLTVHSSGAMKSGST